eukprot:235817-Chlamydomonas_euryale.AAC.2
MPAAWGHIVPHGAACAWGSIPVAWRHGAACGAHGVAWGHIVWHASNGTRGKPCSVARIVRQTWLCEYGLLVWHPCMVSVWCGTPAVGMRGCRTVVAVVERAVVELFRCGRVDACGFMCVARESINQTNMGPRLRCEATL